MRFFALTRPFHTPFVLSSIVFGFSQMRMFRRSRRIYTDGDGDCGDGVGYGSAQLRRNGNFFFCSLPLCHQFLQQFLREKKSIVQKWMLRQRESEWKTRGREGKEKVSKCVFFVPMLFFLFCSFGVFGRTREFDSTKRGWECGTRRKKKYIGSARATNKNNIFYPFCRFRCLVCFTPSHLYATTHPTALNVANALTFLTNIRETTKKYIYMYIHLKYFSWKIRRFLSLGCLWLGDCVCLCVRRWPRMTKPRHYAYLHIRE